MTLTLNDDCIVLYTYISSIIPYCKRWIVCETQSQFVGYNYVMLQDSACYQLSNNALIFQSPFQKFRTAYSVRKSPLQAVTPYFIKMKWSVIKPGLSSTLLLQDSKAQLMYALIRSSIAKAIQSSGHVIPKENVHSARLLQLLPLHNRDDLSNHDHLYGECECCRLCCLEFIYLLRKNPLIYISSCLLCCINCVYSYWTIEKLYILD